MGKCFILDFFYFLLFITHPDTVIFDACMIFTIDNKNTTWNIFSEMCNFTDYFSFFSCSSNCLVSFLICRYEDLILFDSKLATKLLSNRVSVLYHSLIPVLYLICKTVLESTTHHILLFYYYCISFHFQRVNFFQDFFVETGKANI